MRLDTHHHFWKLDNRFTSWPTPDLPAIYRDFDEAQLRPYLDACRIDGTILVQAAPSIAETEYLLGIAKTCSFVKAVVGWIDFEASDALGQLASLAGRPLLKGLRPMVQAETEPHWILNARFTAVLEAMAARDLCFDALILPSQIDDIGALASRHSDLRVVLDHGGKPAIGNGAFAEWADKIERLAQRPNVYCKLSGLWTEAKGKVSNDRIKPYVRHLLDCFGAGRLMWGSDWPVLTLAGPYDAWLSQCEALLDHLGAAEREAIFGLNGKLVYGIA